MNNILVVDHEETKHSKKSKFYLDMKTIICIEVFDERIKILCKSSNDFDIIKGEITQNLEDIADTILSFIREDEIAILLDTG